ncbi:GGDEF domain-containing protein [Hydrogenophilus thermoluteolus]|uniref:diguanylate cyclase n=1 Tax=Hydrogenophilus thermoluteolus TaxID=297 RepID=A0A2Z6DYX1_HYDTE|nr:GGDEF domain-containing protein [Hydrogenophilus thermoluteolus]BBD77746.1 GGDEF domain-containing protein [Hydrogenophilus thermoluteolus]
MLLKHPTELAKETLLRLAEKRLPPTPEHFTRMYCALAGIPEPIPERFQKLLDLPWNDLVRRLIAAWELPHREWTTEMKRRSLERVLATKNPERLFERLSNLVEAWKRAPTRDADFVGENESEANAPEVAPPTPAPLPESGRSAELEPPSRETVVPSYGTDSARDDAAVLIAELVHLLDVILRNIVLFTPHPEWLTGQIELLRQALPESPQSQADLGRLREAEFRLEATLNRQAEIVTARRAAEAELKSLIAHFLDEIAGVTNLSADYQKELEAAADIIEKASDLAEVSPLLQRLLLDTRAMHQEMSRSHRELAAAKAQAEQADARVKALEAQIAALSAQVARDPLTGLLNRRGLEESFAREANRAQRLGSPLCAALLDIDNFKQLNDTLGHQAGDEALVYLARMARTHLRAQDIVGRYGGEEFVLLLPDTPLDQAAEVIRRLQRALTRELFFYGDNHRVITFSAGVTPVLPGEALETVLARADAAMYEAKRSGKNRVIVKKP